MITGTHRQRLDPPIRVAADAEVAQAVQAAVRMARSLDFGKDEWRVALVATEMVTNLVRYARGGRIFVRAVQWGDRPGVELISADGGPGMHDARASVEDGVSTGGNLGTGLGAISRLADLFDLHSVPGQGSVVMARLWRDGDPEPCDRAFDAGGFAEAIPGEEVSGDAWAVEQRGDRLVALLADGLGHGHGAAQAATAAVDCLRDTHRQPVEAIVAAVHRALRPTRGAAVAVAEIDRAAGHARYCGLGNVTGRIVSADGEVSLVSHHGVAGHEARRIVAFEYGWEPGDRLVLHSDGLAAIPDLRAYPGVTRRHPLVLAATIMRDARRRRDDATVLVVGERS